MRPVAWILAITASAGLAAAGMQVLHARARARDPHPPRVAAFLDLNRPAYEQALSRARAWLDQLDVDPIALRAQHLKGKKKLAEQLDAYERLWRVASPEVRPAIVARMEHLAAVTRDPRYHDLGTISDRHLKQDSTSYLRVAVLLERVGIDTALYREKIREAQPRLDAQMSERGGHQRRAFHNYYVHFGLKEPFPLEPSLALGIVARRPPPAGLTRDQVYELTHDVYAAFDYGEDLAHDPFDAESKAYLRAAIPALIARHVAAKDPDVTGELVECLGYLGMEDEPAYLDGLTFVLSSQNVDGSFGRYEKARAQLGDLVRPALELHTTLVAIGALTSAFDAPAIRPR